jgi:hypothetical protein
MSDHPPGTVIVPCSDLARYHAFTVSMLALDLPEDSHVLVVRSMDVTSTLNSCIREMVGEWVWLQADDHHFPPDSLTRLLDRDVDVVVPMMNRKAPPFDLVAYKSETTTIGQDGREYPAYEKFDIDEIPATGLMEIYAAGSGSMLVRKHVLDAIGDPWFHNPQGTVINDDLEFCRKIRDAGYTIWMDTEVSVGHIGHFTSYYSHHNGRWGITMDFGGPGTNRVWLTKEAINTFDASRRKADEDGTAVG